MWNLLFSTLLLGGSAFGELPSGSMSVQGESLGFYPRLADGIRMEKGADSKPFKYTRGHRCLEKVVTQGGVTAGVSLSRFTGSSAIEVAYPLGGEGGGLLPPPELVKAFYQDNIAGSPRPQSIRLLFVPQILTPRPEKLVDAEWTAEARQLLDQNDSAAFDKYCGTHFVSARGEDNYVLYAIRIDLRDPQDRPKLDRISDDVQRQSPSLVIDSLARMRQRFEFMGPGNKVTLDILHIGDSPEELASLRSAVAGWSVGFEQENSNSTLVTRASAECVPEHMESCERLAQAFLDFQYGRFDFKGERPTFAPVRFQLTPFSSIKK